MARGKRPRYMGPDEDLLIRCVGCGKVLNTETGVLASPDWYRYTRYVHYCKECQGAQFEDFKGLFGNCMAYVACCASYNIPFKPEAIPKQTQVDRDDWDMYLENLKMLDMDVTDNGEPAAFSDGVTDLSVIFDGKVPEHPVFAAGLTSGGVAEKLEGTRAQRKNWGLAYKTAEYKELDRLYGIYSSRYVESGIDEMMEFELRELCKLQLSFDQAMGADDPDSKKGKEIIGMMNTLQKNIKDRTQGSKNPTENQIDTVRAAMERAGLTRNGHIIPYKEMLERLQKDHPHYPLSHDMVDYMMLALTNTMRINEGMSELAELPVGLQFEPMFGELEPEMSEKERKLVEAVGLPPLKREKQNGRRTEMGPQDAPVGEERADGDP